MQLFPFSFNARFLWFVVSAVTNLIHTTTGTCQRTGNAVSSFSALLLQTHTNVSATLGCALSWSFASEPQCTLSRKKVIPTLG